MRFLSLLTVLLLSAAACRGQVDFAREVLPVLSENCFHCHGPDDSSRKAKLRLDTKDGATRTRNDIASIVPGKSGDSEVIRRIFCDDDEQMPPADSNRKLTAAQKTILKKWVDEGAKWGTHWAYVELPKSVPVPKVKAATWVRTPPDAFVLQRLEMEGLVPAAETTKAAWLRRVTLDLTGLPPTPAELDRFAADLSAKAYESVVDRLLDSPRYGERMATDWLDLARYADTHGYQSDRPNRMWPWRDWVISSFNRNARFDSFLTEQLAGDLVPNATDAQKLATGFNRLHMQNEEGGIVGEEFRTAYVVDRVNTMGTAFLGQTFECCRCHDHKFDPLTQKDFYSLYAMFQNIDESGQTSFFTNAMNTPTLLLTTKEQEAKIAKLRDAVIVAGKNLRVARAIGKERYEKWLAGPHEKTMPVDRKAEFDFEKIVNESFENGANLKQPARLHDKVNLVQLPPIKRLPGGNAIQLNGENGVKIPGVGNFAKSDPFTIALLIKAITFAPRAVILHHSKAAADAGSRGYELLLENGHVSFGLHHMWPGNSLKVTTRKAMTAGDWHSVLITYEGSSSATGLKIYVDGHPADATVIRDNLTKDIQYDGAAPGIEVGYRFRDNGFKDGLIDSLLVYSRVLTRSEWPNYGASDSLPAANVFNENEFEYYLSAIDKTARARTEELRVARRKLDDFIGAIPEAMVMEELPRPKPAFVLKRGAYDSLGEAVTASTPKSLPALPKELPRNRLGLAKWLTQPDHPLTARVTVNRLWQQMFGRGLVETSDNFGTTGVPPTHPELLDWLARDFIDHGWDIKRTLRQIALSNTYRQSSRTTDVVRSKDPYNHLLARAPVRRLTAEMLRDQAFYASGLLVEKVGGPSVFPVQPAGLWNDSFGKPKYVQSTGDDLHRRSLYTHWKRTAPPPTMTTFDAADRANCAAKRQSTSTPLQALVLLNDPQMVDAARNLAEKMLTEQTVEAGIVLGMKSVLSRAPREEEMKVLLALHDEQRATFRRDPQAAAKLAGPTKRDTVDLVTMMQVALMLFNHDEAVHRR